MLLILTSVVTTVSCIAKNIQTNTAGFNNIGICFEINFSAEQQKTIKLLMECSTFILAQTKELEILTSRPDWLWILQTSSLSLENYMTMADNICLISLRVAANYEVGNIYFESSQLQTAVERSAEGVTIFSFANTSAFYQLAENSTYKTDI